MQQIILISGKASNGKTALANAIKEKLQSHNNKVCIMSCATHLKMILKTYYGWDGIDKSTKWRELLQKLGTDKIREEMKKPFFHINRLCEDVEIISDDFDYIIVDDVRFKGEIYYPKAYFPDKIITIRLSRNNFISPLTPEQQLHASEIDLDSEIFDNVFEIDSGINHVQQCAEQFVEDVLNV